MSDAWKTAAEVAEKASVGKWIKLKNDKDKAIGFLVGDPHIRRTYYDETKSQSETYTDAHKAAGKKETVKFLVNFWIFKDKAYKILSLSPLAFKDLVKCKEKYGMDVAFEVERQGAKGDTNTKYTVLPDIPKTKLAADEIAAWDAAKPWNLAEESDDDDTSTDMNSADKKGAAATSEPISADDSSALTKRLKPLPKATIDKFLAQFSLTRVALLPKARYAEALAFVTAHEAPPAPPPPPAAAAEVDPFA